MKIIAINGSPHGEWGSCSYLLKMMFEECERIGAQTEVIPFFRNFFFRLLAPMGVYEYVIAGTKYIDAVFEKALADRFDQILLFGAGYDTRALRFQDKAQHTHIFKLDAPHTQQAKIKQLRIDQWGIGGIFDKIEKCFKKGIFKPLGGLFLDFGILC